MSNIREINVDKISDAIARMVVEVNHELSPQMKVSLHKAAENEINPVGARVLGQLEENLKIAREDMIPICQDTGMAVVFLEIGQDVHFVGGDLTDAINEGVCKGYTDGYLRKSVVGDPIERVNTGDNTPAVIHSRIVSGQSVRITVAPKGFGSENMSKIYMKKPADGIEGVEDAILSAVKDAGPNACPPMVVGIGIGGTFEKAALLAKEALAYGEEDQEKGALISTKTDTDKGVNSAHEKSKRPQWVIDLEQRMLAEINALGIGPGGLGGVTTALAVHVRTYATHIAGLPVAVNICCHVNRHKTVEI